MIDRFKHVAKTDGWVDILGGQFKIVSIRMSSNNQALQTMSGYPVYISADLELDVDLVEVIATNIQPQEGTKMNRSTTVFLVNKDVMAFRAVYEEGAKLETFKTFDRSIVKDDLVVVVSGTRHGFTTVKVKEVDVGVDIEDNSIEVKWAVCKIELDDHKRILAEESEAIEAVKKAEFNKKRRELMANVADPDDIAAIKALPIYKNGTTAPTVAPKPVV